MIRTEHIWLYVHLHLKRKSKKQRKGYWPPPSTSFLCLIFFSLTCSYAHHSSWPRQQEFLKITPQQLYREKMNLYWAAQAMSHNSPMRVSIGISSQVSIKASGRTPITDSKFRNSECRASRDLDCESILHNSVDRKTNNIQQLAALVWQGVLSLPLSLFTPHPVRRYKKPNKISSTLTGYLATRKFCPSSSSPSSSHLTTNCYPATEAYRYSHPLHLTTTQRDPFYICLCHYRG